MAVKAMTPQKERAKENPRDIDPQPSSDLPRQSYHLRERALSAKQQLNLHTTLSH